MSKLKKLFRYILTLVKSEYSGSVKINFHKGDLSDKIKKEDTVVI